MEKGIVFNIQRYTINDGPGIRTEVFLKGCPLRCEWCSNPESQSLKIEPGVYQAKCISSEKCGLCIKECKKNALLFAEIEQNRNVLYGIDRNKCIGCVKCADACPSLAIKPWGKVMTVDEVLSIVEKDRTFYEKSGGGVTLSGGDPLNQPSFTTELLKAIKEKGISTCLESTFFAPWDVCNKAIEYSDIVISDIKHMNGEIQKKHTGFDNKIMLENLKNIAKEKKRLIIRIPLIPGFNDDQKNIEETADFIVNNLGSSVEKLQILSFMRMGEEKCKSLDRPYLMKDLVFDREKFQERANSIKKYFNDRGINAIVGTKE